MNKLKLIIIDDEWNIRKEVYEEVLSSYFEISAIANPADLSKIVENSVDGYLIDVVLNNWTTDKGHPQELIPILEKLKGKGVPIILVSRNYDVLVKNNQLTDMINKIIKEDFPVKSFLTWSDFEKEFDYSKNGIIYGTVQATIKFWLLSNITHKKEKEADIGIICALSEELSQFLVNFKDEELERQSSDNICYTKGVLKTKNGKIIKFVTALQQEMGTVDAAAIGAMLVKEFNVKHLFMIGVCGGREEKVRIGDIIIPTDSVAYQRGKVTNEGFEFEIGYSQTNVFSRGIFDNCFQITKKIYQQYSSDRVEKGKEGLSIKYPNIHFEPIACGDNVLDKSNALDKISENVAQRKLCAIDMESYAILRLNKFLNIKTIVIKSVMDLANKKSDEYKEYAAYISANFLYEVLKEEIYDVNP